MRCEDCARYDSEARKCKDGKLNPLRWSAAVDMANLMGIRAICSFNDHRERLIAARADTGRRPTGR